MDFPDSVHKCEHDYSWARFQLKRKGYCFFLQTVAILPPQCNNQPVVVHKG